VVHQLPNLLIIGVPKAGTTSLFTYLKQHPAICPSTPKEPNYFTALRQPGATLAPLTTYRQHFSACRGQRFWMEASPGYAVGGPAVIERIKECLDQPRNVLILREPTDRLWSAYTFQKARGRLPAAWTFDEFVSECTRQRQLGTDRLPTNIFAAFSMGYYADFVEQWLDAFGNDIRIVFTDELSSDPHQVVERLCRWLDIDHTVTQSFDYERRMTTLQSGIPMLDRAAYLTRRIIRPLRPTSAVRSIMRSIAGPLNGLRPSSEELSDRTRARVDDMYRASNVALSMCLRNHGYNDLPSWLPAPAGLDV